MKADSREHILVVGGAGYIGSHTVRALVKAGYQVTVLDNLCHGHAAALVDKGVCLVKEDMGDRKAMRSLFDSNPFDAVINFAGYINVGESVQDPLKYYENNVGRATRFLISLQEAGVRKLVFSSTCATYGAIASLPITESEAQAPINPYGTSKYMYEQILKDCDTAWGLKSVCLRYFNACGASKDGLIGEDHAPETHLIPLILQAAKGIRNSIRIYGTDYETPDGTCIRDYIHVEDLAEAHVKSVARLLEGGDSLQCNIGTGKGYSVREVIEAVRAVTETDFEVEEVARRAGDPAELVADTSLAKHALNWHPQHSSLENIVNTAWKWMETNDGHYSQTPPTHHSAHGGIFS